MTPSPYQQRFLDFAKQQTTSCRGITPAGGGKTTLLTMIADCFPPKSDFQIDPSPSILALCFNKEIAEQMKGKFKGNVRVSTLHAFQLSILRETGKTIKVSNWKQTSIAKRLDEENKYQISQLAGLLYANLCTSKTEAIEIAELAGFPDPEALSIHALELIRLSRAECPLEKKKWEISFNDMMDLPLYHNLPYPSFDICLVDEAQDFTKQDLAVLLKLKEANPNIRFFCVGDPRQSIYAFRGAMCNSMDILYDTLELSETFFQPISYRCPKQVILWAQDIVGKEYILPKEDAEEGEVIFNSPLDYFKTLKESNPKDMILCRNNKPLVRPFFDLVLQGKKATIRGKDIGEGLIKIATSCKNDKKREGISFEERRKGFLFDVDVYAALKEAEYTKKKAFNAIKKLKENVEILKEILRNLSKLPNEVYCISDYIEVMFSDEVDGILLSTIHKAKGLEAQRVVFLAPELISSPYAITKEELAQEENLRYVAITRSLHTLIFQPLKEDEEW